jgi:hypothetical protein
MEEDSDDDYSITSQSKPDIVRRTEAKGYDLFEIKTNKRIMRGGKMWEKVEKKEWDGKRSKEKKVTNNIFPNRRRLEREADEKVNRMINKGADTVEVVIESSEEEEDKDDENCVRVILKEDVTKKMLSMILGRAVPLVSRHPCHYISVKRGHSVVVCYKREHKVKLLQLKSDFAKFIEYEQVEGDNDYVTVKVLGEFEDVSENDLRMEMEKVFKERVIGGHYLIMKDGIAYVDFQTDRVWEKLERMSYIKVKKRYLTVEPIELKSDDPNKLIFFWGLGT